MPMRQSNFKKLAENISFLVRSLEMMGQYTICKMEILVVWGGEGGGEGRAGLPPCSQERIVRVSLVLSLQIINPNTGKENRK